MPKYVLRVEADHDFMPLWYAFVDLDREFLQFIKVVRRIGVRALKQMHDTFLRVEYIDFRPAFCEQAIPPEFDAFVTSEAWHADGKALLPDDVELPKGGCMSIATLQVEDDGFRWTVRPKHCDQDGYTATIYYSEVLGDV